MRRCLSRSLDKQGQMQENWLTLREARAIRSCGEELGSKRVFENRWLTVVIYMSKHVHIPYLHSMETNTLDILLPSFYSLQDGFSRLVQSTCRWSIQRAANEACAESPTSAVLKGERNNIANTLRVSGYLRAKLRAIEATANYSPSVPLFTCWACLRCHA